MAFKFIAAFAFVALAAAEAPQYSYQPTHLVEHHDEHHENPVEYKFEYSVHDEHTGDIKEQHETRQGDRVEGYYTLVEADGHRRIVHYTADKHNGFNAKVEREPTDYKIPQPAQKVYAAPAVHHAAPVVYHTPAVQHVAYNTPAVKQVSHQAPVVHYQAPARYTHIKLHQAPALQHVTYHAPAVKHVAPVVHAAQAQYAHHGEAQSTVSVQSHGVNYHY